MYVSVPEPLILKFLVEEVQVVPVHVTLGNSISNEERSAPGKSPVCKRYRSAAYRSVPISVIASLERAFSTAVVYCGKAMADRMPIISTTTNNSINVTPFFMFFLLV